jgi:hypothetical protein
MSDGILCEVLIFQADYAPADIEGVALCEGSDAALEWACEQEDIRVETMDRDESVWAFD